MVEETFRYVVCLEILLKNMFEEGVENTTAFVNVVFYRYIETRVNELGEKFCSEVNLILVW